MISVSSLLGGAQCTTPRRGSLLPKSAAMERLADLSLFTALLPFLARYDGLSGVYTRGCMALLAALWHAGLLPEVLSPLITV